MASLPSQLLRISGVYCTSWGPKSLIQSTQGLMFRTVAYSRYDVPQRRFRQSLRSWLWNEGISSSMVRQRPLAPAQLSAAQDGGTRRTCHSVGHYITMRSIVVPVKPIYQLLTLFTGHYRSRMDSGGGMLCELNCVLYVTTPVGKLRPAAVDSNFICLLHTT
jgi:hypothetical protein